MSKQELTLVVRAQNMVAQGLSGAANAIKGFASRVGSVIGGVADVFKNVAMAVGIVGGAALAVGKRAVAMYQTETAEQAKLEATLKATGYAAGLTASELKKVASELQKTTGVGDETIISMQGILATFRNVKGDTFKSATVAILDMGAAMGKAGVGSADVEAAVIQVGKALNDPIAGMSALSRVGVQFTDEQKEMIKALQESGDLAGAQAIILKELQDEFGGMAKAVADSSKGLVQLKNAFGDMQEEIGRAIVESTGFEGVIHAVTAAIESLTSSGLIEYWAENVRASIATLAATLQGVGKAFAWMKSQVEGAAAFWGAVAGGADTKEALKAMDEIPKKVKEIKNARLEAIRAEREARQKAKEEAEKSEIAIAQSAGVVTDEYEQQADAQSAGVVTDEYEQQADSLEKINGLLEDRKALEEKIAAAMKAEHVDAFEKEADAAQQKIDNNKEVAGMNVDQFIERKRQDQDREKAAKAELRKEASLRAKMERGTKLSKADQEFIVARDAINQAGGKVAAGMNELDVAKQNLEQIKKDGETLNKMLGELKDLNGDIQKLLAMG
jgi:phage-related minor tail protein